MKPNFQHLPVDSSFKCTVPYCFSGRPNYCEIAGDFSMAHVIELFFHEDESMKKNYTDIYNMHSTQKSHE